MIDSQAILELLEDGRNGDLEAGESAARELLEAVEAVCRAGPNRDDARSEVHLLVCLWLSGTRELPDDPIAYSAKVAARVSRASDKPHRDIREGDAMVPEGSAARTLDAEAIIDGLPIDELDRLISKLHFVGGMTLREIAGHIDVTLHRVRVAIELTTTEAAAKLKTTDI